MSFRDSQRLENAIDSARNEAPRLSDENQARLAQLMTVLASGYLEATCREVLKAYAAQRADPSVVRYVSANLERFNSPKIDNILTLVGSFDPGRERDLKQFVEGPSHGDENSVKESINSIVGLRNQIAHGRPIDVSIGRVARYFEDAKNSQGNWKAFFPLRTGVRKRLTQGEKFRLFVEADTETVVGDEHATGAKSRWILPRPEVGVGATIGTT